MTPLFNIGILCNMPSLLIHATYGRAVYQIAGVAPALYMCMQPCYYTWPRTRERHEQPSFVDFAAELSPNRI